MRFCDICRNYLFLKEEQGEEGGLYFHCAHCGYKEQMKKPASAKEALILEARFGTSEKPENLINEFTRLDPTLPHLRGSIPCPNDECESQRDPSKRDILFIRTDPRDLKYQYCCMTCNTTWGN